MIKLILYFIPTGVELLWVYRLSFLGHECLLIRRLKRFCRPWGVHDWRLLRLGHRHVRNPSPIIQKITGIVGTGQRLPTLARAEKSIMLSIDLICFFLMSLIRISTFSRSDEWLLRPESGFTSIAIDDPNSVQRLFLYLFGSLLR